MLRQLIRGYCYTIILFFAVVSLRNCIANAHAASPPPPPKEWHNAIAKHCHFLPVVRITPGVDASDKALIREAVGIINTSAGTRLIALGQPINPKESQELMEAVERDVIIVSQATRETELAQCRSKEGCVHAHTKWAKRADGCFMGVHVELQARPGALSENVRLHVIIHELLHALGLTHNPFPVAGSFINQFAPAHAATRPSRLGDFELMRLCGIYDCTPEYLFDPRGVK